MGIGELEAVKMVGCKLGAQDARGKVLDKGRQVRVKVGGDIFNGL